MGSLSEARPTIEIASASDPVTTVAEATVAARAERANSWLSQHADPSLLVEQGGDIVCAARNGRERAMSARRILGLESVPRVGLFAH